MPKPPQTHGKQINSPWSSNIQFTVPFPKKEISKTAKTMRPSLQDLSKVVNDKMFWRTLFHRVVISRKQLLSSHTFYLISHKQFKFVPLSIIYSKQHLFLPSESSQQLRATSEACSVLPYSDQDKMQPEAGVSSVIAQYWWEHWTSTRET